MLIELESIGRVSLSLGDELSPFSEEVTDIFVVVVSREPGRACGHETL